MTLCVNPPRGTEIKGAARTRAEMGSLAPDPDWAITAGRHRCLGPDRLAERTPHLVRGGDFDAAELPILAGSRSRAIATDPVLLLADGARVCVRPF